jgi:hypothetical protein
MGSHRPSLGGCGQWFVRQHAKALAQEPNGSCVGMLEHRTLPVRLNAINSCQQTASWHLPVGTGAPSLSRYSSHYTTSAAFDTHLDCLAKRAAGRSRRKLLAAALRGHALLRGLIGVKHYDTFHW